MSDRLLLWFIVGVGIMTTYLVMTAPDITAQERKDVEEDWWD